MGGSLGGLVTALVDPQTIAPTLATTRFTAMVVVPDSYARMQVARRLRALGAREVVEAASLLQARAWARTSGPRDLCIVDIVLPDGNGLALLAELRRNGWHGGIGVSPVTDLRLVAAAMNAGVKGFILAPRRPLQQGRSGQPAQPTRNGSGVLGDLSRREVEVIRYVADGRSNRDIGEAMGLSALTVKSHLARIARKLGTGDRAGMVAISLRTGVIT
jgi:DNA-binding NarL/FixJ family response regulator